MNIVSVQVYSDPNTPWNRSRIDFPISVEKTIWPGNGCGLCNQIFKLMNTIAFNQGRDIYVDLFSIDYIDGHTVCVSDILDLEQMRKNGLRIYDIIELDYRQPYLIRTYPAVYSLYHMNRSLFTSIAKSLRFTTRYEKIAKTVILNKGLLNKIVNLVHLRIDLDYKNLVVATSGPEKYSNLIEKYRSLIYSNFDKSIPLVLLLEETTHEFVKELQKDYEVYMFEKSDVLSIDPSICGREIFALIDMLSAKELNVDNFIGFYGSTFSLILNNIINTKKSIIIE